MKHLSSIVLAAALVAAGAVACFKDPTSSLRNGASRILLTRSSVFLPVGDSVSVQAELKDEQGNTFDVPDATWTTSNAAVVVVNADLSKPIPYAAFSRAFVRTTGAGRATVYFAASGLTDSVVVVGIPATFDGAISAPAGTMMGDTITIAGTSVLSFSAGTTVDIDGGDAYILSQTASELKILASQPGSTGTLTLHDVTLLGTITVSSLRASTAVPVAATVRSANEPANDDPVTAPAFTLYASPLYGVMTAADIDDYWKFTTPATGDSVDVALEWKTDADIDGYLLNATGGCAGVPAGGCAAMGTSANPEEGHFRLAANTTYLFDVNLYDKGAASAIMYRLTFTKVQ